MHIGGKCRFSLENPIVQVVKWKLIQADAFHSPLLQIHISTQDLYHLKNANRPDCAAKLFHKYNSADMVSVDAKLDVHQVEKL